MVAPRGRTAQRLAASAILAAVSGVLTLLGAGEGAGPQLKSPEAALQEVYREVREMGSRAGQDFIHWDFFIGEDDDDTNKTIHAAVVISGERESRRMTIRVSWMERIPGEPQAWRAGANKMLSCAIENDSVRLIRTEFAEKEWSILARGLLKAIRDKKNLLGLIK